MSGDKIGKLGQSGELADFVECLKELCLSGSVGAPSVAVLLPVGLHLDTSVSVLWVVNKSLNLVRGTDSRFCNVYCPGQMSSSVLFSSFSRE